MLYEFKQYLYDQGYTYENVPGDGNCLIHTINILYPCKNWREMIYEYILNNKDNSEMRFAINQTMEITGRTSIDKNIEEILHNGEALGNEALIAISHILDIPINLYVYSYDTQSGYMTQFNSKSNKKPISIGLMSIHTDGHYVPLFELYNHDCESDTIDSDPIHTDLVDLYNCCKRIAKKSFRNIYKLVNNNKDR